MQYCSIFSLFYLIFETCQIISFSLLYLTLVTVSCDVMYNRSISQLPPTVHENLFSNYKKYEIIYISGIHIFKSCLVFSIQRNSSLFARKKSNNVGIFNGQSFCIKGIEFSQKPWFSNPYIFGNQDLRYFKL